MDQYNRKCKTCGKLICHKSYRSFCQSLKNDLPCRSCSAVKRIEKYGFGTVFEQMIKNQSGSKNPFFGKKHTKEAIEKIKQRDKSFFQSSEYKLKQSVNSSGSKNPMFGKSVYQIWLERYGREKADKLMQSFKETQSINSSGKKNPMYGKNSPQGSGNGWSGWYNGWYFRSLRELSYAYSLDKDNIIWQSAESMSIPYVDHEGIDRSYHPDFLVEKKLIIEIKPTRLRNTAKTLSKELAALDYCKQHNFHYIIVDPEIISREILVDLKNHGKVKFLPRYEEKFLKLLSATSQ